MKYFSKKFRKENFFILYDLNDNIIAYFDSYDDLEKSNIIHYTCSDLVYKINIYGNPLPVCINKKKYFLYTTTDYELGLIL